MANYLNPTAAGKSALTKGTSMYLGTIVPDPETVREEMEAYVNLRRNHIRNTVDGLKPKLARQYMRENSPLLYSEYINALKRVEGLAIKRRRHHHLTENMGDFKKWAVGRDDYIFDDETGEDPAVIGLRDCFITHGSAKYTPTVQGWLQYLIDLNFEFNKTITMITSPPYLQSKVFLDEGTRRGHTLISAGSGGGKSELMKALVHHYLQDSSAAVVVIDPHPDMGRQISRWREFARQPTRLAYIEPGLVEGHAVPLNPLALGYTLTDRARKTFGEFLSRTITELIPAAELTPNMQTLIQQCISVLIEHESSTFQDLYDLIGPKVNTKRDFFIKAASRHGRQEVARFFKSDGDFHQPYYSQTKQSLRARLDRLFLTDGFIDFTCANGFFDFNSAVNNKQFVIFNLSSLSEQGRVALGRLVLMMMWSLGHRRMQNPAQPRVPVHVFVDEATLFVGTVMVDLLKEMRKVGIHLTIAQQSGGEGFSPEMRQ
jgi:hypothetical protein